MTNGGEVEGGGSQVGIGIAGVVAGRAIGPGVGGAMCGKSGDSPGIICASRCPAQCAALDVVIKDGLATQWDRGVECEVHGMNQGCIGNIIREKSLSCMQNPDVG